MGNLGFFDTILNLCRTWSDVFHILTYLAIAIAFLLYGLRKADRWMYKQYIYTPLRTLWLRIWYAIVVSAYFIFSKFILPRMKNVNVKSNRKIYKNKKK